MLCFQLDKSCVEMKNMSEKFERFTFAITEIYRYLHKLTSKEMKKYGLKGPHSIYILTMYHYPDGITASRMCELCGKDKSDVSRAMSVMEKKGLVKKEGIYQNLYRGVFKLTEKGKAIAECVDRRCSLAVEFAGKNLTGESSSAFFKGLESIVSNLRKLSKEGLPQE